MLLEKCDKDIRRIYGTLIAIGLLILFILIVLLRIIFMLQERLTITIRLQ
jgi:hypothetical protein